jgi:acetyl esterase/lipase
VSTPPPAVDAPDGVTVWRDVVHTVVEGHRPLSLDLYVPDAGARALCIYLHGGGWRRGSRRAGPGPISPSSARSFGRMAHGGLAVASVDYRLSGEARYPAQAEDVRAAGRWLLGDLASPVRDLPLVVFGVSAGGQLAGVVALDGSLPVHAAALWYAVSDLTAMPDDQDAVDGSGDRSPDSREALLLGAPAHEVPDLARSASPVALVHTGAPPFTLVHGAVDVLVPAAQSDRLHRALQAVGAASSLELVPGRDHMFPGIPADELDALVDRTTAFLLDHATA